MGFFGGGFTGSPNNVVKLRQAPGPFIQAALQGAPQGGVPIALAGTKAPQPFTQHARQLGIVPAQYAPPPTQDAQLQQALPAPTQLTQGNGAMGPSSYPVMKKGEAPCPICRG